MVEERCVSWSDTPREKLGSKLNFHKTDSLRTREETPFIFIISLRIRVEIKSSLLIVNSCNSPCNSVVSLRIRGETLSSKHLTIVSCNAFYHFNWMGKVIRVETKPSKYLISPTSYLNCLVKDKCWHWSNPLSLVIRLYPRQTLDLYVQLRINVETKISKIPMLLLPNLSFE